MRSAQHLISGGTQTKAPPSIAAHIASNAIDFFRVMKKSQLLPLNAADTPPASPARRCYRHESTDQNNFGGVQNPRPSPRSRLYGLYMRSLFYRAFKKGDYSRRKRGLCSVTGVVSSSPSAERCSLADGRPVQVDGLAGRFLRSATPGGADSETLLRNRFAFKQPLPHAHR